MAGLTFSRMDFGNFIQGIRKRAPHPALSRAAAHLEVTRFVLMRVEDGLPTRLTTPQLESLLDHYAATPEDRAEALRLWSEVRDQDKTAKAQGNSKGFWKAYTDQIAPNFPKFLRLEGAANHIVAHQPTIVPGLLQTPEYRRAIVRMSEPDLSAVDLERRLELTARRQARLDETGFRLEVFLSEAVLLHRPAEPSAMSGQLRWLAEVGERENVDINVIPFSCGPHPGLAMHVFNLLRFPAGASGISLPPVVYAEGAIGSTFHEHSEEVSEYRRAIEGMRAVALTARGTRDLVLKVAKEYAA
ncbi:DUF5753 domain-containing protein [Nocardia sp. NPDC056100]|uniref:DUF5753 domain-containing protein n=1 Tax=Nocardia sp. NPDC056100 TaxID=3345712 RepID=UPI0035D6D9CE